MFKVGDKVVNMSTREICEVLGVWEEAGRKRGYYFSNFVTVSFWNALVYWELTGAEMEKGMKDRSCEVCVQKSTCKTLADAWEVIARRVAKINHEHLFSKLSYHIANCCILFKIGSEQFKITKTHWGMEEMVSKVEKEVRFVELKVCDKFRLIRGNYENLHEKVNLETDWTKASFRYGLSEYGMPLKILFDEKVIKL